jgi:Uma2 family endonuclease
VHTSDLRIRVEATGLATYPDVSVVCGHVESDPLDRNTVVNPTLIVEVLSDSTEDYDRLEKLEHYKQIPALQEIVLVSHREPRIDVWRRTETGWAMTTATSGQTADLPSVHATLVVDALYADPLARP